MRSTDVILRGNRPSNHFFVISISARPALYDSFHGSYAQFFQFHRWVRFFTVGLAGDFGHRFRIRF